MPEPRTPEHRIGRYRIHDAIASGGMAVVHLGRLVGAAGFARTVAIKRLHPHLATHPEFVTMLLDEARLAVRVKHANVAPILDVIVERGEVCLVLEYVHGESLARLLAKAQENGEKMPVRIALAIVIGMLRGLAAAHEATADDGTPLGLVHRDVSPQNVLVGADGIARVIDFGIAKATARLQATENGQLKGKFAYMAPEQLTLAPLDARTDVFAAGVVLWETLAGRGLFEATDLDSVVRRTVEATVDPPSLHASEVSAALDRLVLQALSLRPEARFPGAAAMAQALEESGPSASPDEVAEWVRRIAGEELLVRQARVAAVESGRESTPTLGAAAELPTSVPQAPQASPASPADAPSPAKAKPHRRIARQAAMILVVGGAVTIAFVSGSRLSRSPRAGTARVEPSATPIVDPAPPDPSVAVSVAVAVAGPTADPQPAASASSVPARRRPASPNRGGATPAGTQPSYCSQRKLAFTVGPDGIERPRPECL